MTSLNLPKLVQLAKELSDALTSAAYYAHEIQSLVQLQLRNELGESDGQVKTKSDGFSERPMLDQSTYSVTWQGRSLHLGHTRCFWLLARLVRRPNQYVTHLDLLNDVWDDEELTTATIRSTVCQLRRRLRKSRMRHLADAIRGHNGHYILEL